MADIKSNQLKDIPFPVDFTDLDKEEYIRLLNLAMVEHSDVYESNKWIIHYGIIMHIRKEKGFECPFNEKELNEIVERYKTAEWTENKEVKCTGNETPYLYDKDNNPMFKDNSFFFKNDDEGNKAETIAEDKVVVEKK